MNGGAMSESKDQAIKLFGRKILVPECHMPATSLSGSQIPLKLELIETCSEITKAEAEDPVTSEPDKSSALGNSGEEKEIQIQENDAGLNSKSKEYQAETNNNSIGQERVFKKPDKIIPCPRCKSSDTKFCYFNNYNVNQPRHFCKNCQRYWTAGGTMRNVPIGAGRRKNKHLASQYRQMIVSSDGIPVTQTEGPDSATHHHLSSGECVTTFTSSVENGVVLKFGPETPICESMETVLNLGEQKRCIEMGTQICGKNMEEPSSSGSSMTNSGILGNELSENAMQNEQVVLPGSCNKLNPQSPLQCYPISQWAIPWNSGWNNVASQDCSEKVRGSNNNNKNPTQWGPAPMVAIPGFCPPGVPLQFVPASYWGCVPVWAAATVPLSGSNGCTSPPLSTTPGGCSGTCSPILGKHSREADSVNEDQSEKCVLVPNTVRIDDPDEAAKSPIWAAIGITPDKKNPKCTGTIFKTFETKADGKGRVVDAPQILEANLAALSRSHTFQEST